MIIPDKPVAVLYTVAFHATLYRNCSIYGLKWWVAKMEHNYVDKNVLEPRSLVPVHGDD